MTQCNSSELLFQDLGPRQVVARFDAGHVTSDGGGLLLREVEAKFGFIERFAGCFSDHRDPDVIEHSVMELLKQRIFGLCWGLFGVSSVSGGVGARLGEAKDGIQRVVNGYERESMQRRRGANSQRGPGELGVFASLGLCVP